VVPTLYKNTMSPVGPLLPIQHVRYEVGSLSETGPPVLDTRLSPLDPKPDILGDKGAQKGSVTVGTANRTPHLRGGEKGATSVLWKAAICHTPASLTKTRRLSS